jgi:hypothetical protein
MAGLGFVDSFRAGDDERDFPAGDSVPGIRRYYGKYRGTVLAAPIPDPEQRGRVFVQVDDRDGPNVTGWARPCLPWGGLSMGSYIVPPPATKVWVEFEHGHPDYPIWVGCMWGSAAEAPTIAKLSVPGAPIFALESFAKHVFVVSDTPLLPHLPSGGILIGNAAAGIAIDVSGVRIFGLTVQLNGLPGDISGVSAALLVK